MGIIKNTIRDKIKYDKQHSSDVAIATVLEYDIVSNKATIEYANPTGGGLFRRMNVAVSNNLGGMNGTAIKPGAKVHITFRQGNLYCPVITGMINTYYLQKTSTDQGATIVDSYIADIEIPDEITPLSEQWFDEDNQYKEKYVNDYTQYKDKEIDDAGMELIREIDHFKPDEEGVVQLGSNSCIRMRDNGDIDIFAGNNTGIRISGKYGIQLFGKNNFGGGIIQSVDIDVDNTNAIIKANTDDAAIQEYSTKIADIIKETEEKVKELAEITEQLVIITRNPNRYASLNGIITRFNGIKNRYRKMIIGVTLDEITSVYVELVNIKEAVNEEYYAAQSIINGTSSS